MKTLSLKYYFKILFELTKFRITSFVTVTTFFGYVLYSHQLEMQIISVLLGVLFLSGGSAIFNHFQEKTFDGLMSRTANRPIPSGKVQPATAFLLGLIYSIGGMIILYAISGLITALLGLIALIWYNGIYTPMKRKFALAVVPGSLIGSIPPVIGWVAAGGNIFDSKILMIAMFFFIWQIPHFWLLMIFFDEDYKKAGYPTLTDYFSKEQICRVTFIWMFALAIASFALPLFNLIENQIVEYALIITAIWMIWNSLKLINNSADSKILIKGFRVINTYLLLIVFQLSVDKFF